ncbi:NTP transferase domain-containing protein [Bacteriovorax sp. Seq25_V]|uniref:NTP transferase domain-containing protein n=1 Tax=Bacteriovorax sp. Seq25_V TaxID=1201288 RepID=UPI00038A21E0|nr:NTP transferase domain-containing protein [Bacteriovorax sp. Seq25_V]EQC45416.1 MobA-like NTP transferase domain protein [Bacteriovorax sp. Seq25_V]
MALNIYVLASGRSKRLTVNNCPKPFLPIGDELLIEHSVKSNTRGIDFPFKIKFVVNDRISEDKNYSILKERYPDASFINIGKETRGALESLYAAMKIDSDLDLKDGVVSLDCDLGIDARDFWTEIKKSLGKPRLCIFDSTNDSFSFVRTQKNNVLEIKEKVCISNQAVAGLYYLGNSLDLVERIRKIIESENETELYISLLFNEYLKNGDLVEFSVGGNHESFGVLDEYLQYVDKIKDI